jgi:hypothetical protein
MKKTTLFAIAAATVLALSSAYQVATEITGTDEWYYSYPGDQVHRGDVYRHGPPENGGYRGGYYGGRNTYYDD